MWQIETNHMFILGTPQCNCDLPLPLGPVALISPLFFIFANNVKAPHIVPTSVLSLTGKVERLQLRL